MVLNRVKLGVADNAPEFTSTGLEVENLKVNGSIDGSVSAETCANSNISNLTVSQQLTIRNSLTVDSLQGQTFVSGKVSATNLQASVIVSDLSATSYGGVLGKGTSFDYGNITVSGTMKPTTLTTPTLNAKTDTEIDIPSSVFFADCAILNSPRKRNEMIGWLNGSYVAAYTTTGMQVWSSSGYPSEFPVGLYIRRSSTN